MLVSWDEVVKKYGECSAYTALSQGTLPYVPHTLLMPGHQVQWPNSHQFVLSRQFWTATWKDELDFLVGREDEMPSHETINRFLRENGFIGGSDSLPARASVGMPSDIEMPQPAPPAPTVEVKPETMTAAVRAVHPDYSGLMYDTLHRIVIRNTRTVLREWPKHRSKHEKILAKASFHNLAIATCDEMRAILKEADTTFNEIKEAFVIIEVHGKGRLSKAELNSVQEKNEDLHCHSKYMYELAKILTVIINFYEK